MRIPLMVVALLFAVVQGFAQPANDNCSGAIALTVSATGACANGIPGTTIAATQSQVGCLGGAEDDVWYKFTATNTEHVIRFAYDNPTFMEPVIELFSGTCGSLVSLKCTERKIKISTAEDIFTGLTPGTEYYFRVYDKNAASLKYTFTICVYVPVVNDLCPGAISIPINTDTSWALSVEGSFQYATGTDPHCKPTAVNYNDVWYTFTATDTVHLMRFLVRSSNFGQGLSVQAYSGTCGSLVPKLIGNATLSSCIAPDNSQEYYELRQLTPGASYYFRVMRDSTAYTSKNFNIAISNPPKHDVCENAIEVIANAGANCAIRAVGNMQNSTALTLAGGCNGGVDVWYKFTAVAARHVVSVRFPQANNGSISIYSGMCGSLAPVGCGTNPWAFGGVKPVEVTGLTPGVVYYIRVTVSSVGTTGLKNVPIEVCVASLTTPLANEDCNTALPLSSVLGDVTLGSHVGTTNGTATPGVTCGSSTRDLWYSITPPYNAYVGIHLWESNTGTVEIAAFNGTCGALNFVACRTNDIYPQSIFFNALASNTYYVRINGPSAGSYGIAVTTLNQLPVTLTDFRIDRITDKSITVRWLTKEESKMKAYFIQRSADGLNFTDISSLPARNQSSNDYSFTDNAPLTGRNYYRLKIVDIDNKIEYSKIIDASLKNAGSFSVYSSNKLLMIMNDKSSAARVSINIYDEAGRQLVKKDIVLKPGVNAISGLMPASGSIILVHLSSDEGQKVFKIRR
jgi:hypothetical protein